jgi:hypothetical protein
MLKDKEKQQQQIAKIIRITNCKMQKLQIAKIK